MNIIFMGTPDFAAGVLRKIYDSKEHNVVLAVTQPDRPKGRSKAMVASAVKNLALELGIPVFQPEKIKTEEAVNKLKEYEADIFVVAAFGQILSEEILNMPRLGCINVHASLLPKYRGAAPIQWSIADGLNETGVTIMQMDKGLDTGDIITQCKVAITKEDTGESLFDKLMDSGSTLLVDTLKLIEEGKATRTPQNHDESTYAKILRKEMGLIDFTLSACEIDNRMRAFTPWPGSYTYFEGKMLKIKAASVVRTENAIDDATRTKDAACGEIVKVTKNELIVKCGEDVLSITKIQPEGKKEMSVHDYLLGKKIEAGMKMGDM